MDDFPFDDAIALRNIKTDTMEKDMVENHGRNHIRLLNRPSLLGDNCFDSSVFATTSST